MADFTVIAIIMCNSSFPRLSQQVVNPCGSKRQLPLAVAGHQPDGDIRVLTRGAGKYVRDLSCVWREPVKLSVYEDTHRKQRNPRMPDSAGEVDGESAPRQHFPVTEAAFETAKHEAIGKFNTVCHIPQTNQFINLDHGKGRGPSAAPAR